MKLSVLRLAAVVFLLLPLFILTEHSGEAFPAKEQHLLYVAVPGIRNYVEYGGVGILVFDIDNGHRFVRRIKTWDTPAGGQPENIKGIAASARTGKLYITTTRRMACFDLLTDKMLWDREYEGGTDRMAISPDGSVIYIPSFEGPHWNVVNAANGDVIKKIELNSGAHNTAFGPDGTRVYLAGLKSPLLAIADPKTHTVVSKAGPFSQSIRPFTINGKQTLCFVNVNELLGFEVGDLRTGKVLHRVEVKGYEKGPVKRHGCPSHGIGLTPDEKEIWLADGANSAMHIFDATQMPPVQKQTLKLRDQPGWVTFSIDGKLAYPSSGEVFEVKTKKMVTALKDETGRDVGSEKLLEIVFANGKPVRNGDQFGIGMR